MGGGRAGKKRCLRLQISHEVTATAGTPVYVRGWVDVICLGCFVAFLLSFFLAPPHPHALSHYCGCVEKFIRVCVFPCLVLGRDGVSDNVYTN